ncbi:MAG: nitroreductase family protein [Bacteroidales bacterium]|nr:nitroreductase family protein [Bacteroidales bacterium]
MADNYLEKRYDEVFGHDSGKTVIRRNSPSLETLMRRNRSCRAYDLSYEVMEAQLMAMVRANAIIASARNQQALRFKLLTKRSGSERMQGLYKLGRALPELHLPAPDTAPEAFIIICSTLPECKDIYIDLGISCQSMLLKACELGLCGDIVCNFNKEEVRKTFDLPYEPLAIIAVGKGIESANPVETGEPEDLLIK